MHFSKKKILIVLSAILALVLLLLLGYAIFNNPSDDEVETETDDTTVETNCEYNDTIYTNGDEFTSEEGQECLCYNGTIVCALDVEEEEDADETNGSGTGTADTDSGSTDTQQDTTNCTGEGESYAVVPDYKPCCSGLTPISCAAPESDGICPPGCTGSTTCTKCGDGVCKTGENKCNCPEDCDNTQTCGGMSLAEAQSIVKHMSDCESYGTVDYNGTCTFSGTTWGFTLSGTEHDEGCDPTCYVTGATGDYELNWQCTGDIVP